MAICREVENIHKFKRRRKRVKMKNIQEVWKKKNIGNVGDEEK